MRLAYIFDQRLPSTETDTEQALNTLTALGRHGVDATLWLPRHTYKSDVDADLLREYYQVDGPFEVKHLRSAFPSIRLFEKMGHALRVTSHFDRDQYDVVYTRNVPTLLSGLSQGLPMAYETYRPWPKQYPISSSVFRWAMKRPRFMGGVFHSSYAMKTYLDLGVDPERLRVVYNGFDPRRFERELSTTEARTVCGLDAGGLVVGYVGRVSPQKGLGLVLDLAARNPDVTFLLVGSEGEGEIEERAAKMDNVIVKPWARYDELPAYLFAADILLIPPTVGPLAKVGNTVLPMKLFQYLASGRAIMAPRAPDTEELLTHEGNAYLVEPDDLDSAHAALAALKEQDDLRAMLGLNARSMADSLSWDARAKKIINFLDGRLKAVPENT